ncbi:hypothetical protein KCU64_g3, partial [Aureobasidium melanogenum]
MTLISRPVRSDLPTLWSPPSGFQRSVTICKPLWAVSSDMLSSSQGFLETIEACAQELIKSLSQTDDDVLGVTVACLKRCLDAAKSVSLLDVFSASLSVHGEQSSWGYLVVCRAQILRFHSPFCQLCLNVSTKPVMSRCRDVASLEVVMSKLSVCASS